jgi:HlyD family secretion protein
VNAALKPRRRRINPWWGFALIPVIAVGLFASGIIKLPGAGATSSAAAKVETVTTTRGTFRISVTGPGTLEASSSLDVKPSVQGTVSSLPVVGQRVTKGQLVARLEADTFQRALENAQLSLDKAQAQLSGTRATQASNRSSQTQSIATAQTQFSNAQRDVQTAETALTNAKALFNIGGGTQQAVTDARTQLEKAQATLESSRVALQTAQGAVGLKGQSDTQDLRNLELAVQQAQITVKNARTDLANTKIYAPQNGVVSAVPSQIGAPASSAGLLFTLLDDTKVNLPVQVDETEIGQVKLGQSAEVTLDALSGQSFTGKVTRISPQATVVSNIAVFYVTVTLSNTKLVLRPGMSAEAEIIAREIKDAVIVPRRAVESVRTRSYVVVQTGTGEGATTERTRVTTAGDDGTNIAVTSGLNGGETLVLPTRSTSTTTRSGGLLPPVGGGR